MKPTLRHAQLRLFSSTKQTTFICPRCRMHSASRQFSSTRSSPASSEPDNSSNNKPDFTQRLRRRIWGTDNPPGQKDPYKRLSAEEKAIEAMEAEALGSEKDLARETAGEVARRRDSGEYLPAESWEGLERIGGATGWWEEAWDRDNVYRGFLTDGSERMPHGAGADVAGLVRRVAVEIMALREAGVSLQDGAKAEWLGEELLEEIDIVHTEKGGFALREQAPDLIDELVEGLQRQDQPELQLEQEDIAEEPVAEAVEQQDLEEKRLLEELHAEEDAAAAAVELEAQTQDEGEAAATQEIQTVATTKVHDPLYLSLPLTDLAFKFAVVKRLTYLTGKRIPDPRINSFSTLGDIVEYLSEKPKPKKLAEILQAMPDLQALPNVEILPGRRTFVHKEMEIGRWKVIEAELRRRGLPVRKSERVMR